MEKFIKGSGPLPAYLVPVVSTARIEMGEDGSRVYADWELPFQIML